MLAHTCSRQYNTGSDLLFKLTDYRVFTMLTNDKNNIVKLTLISIMLAVINSGCYERTSSDYYAYQGPVMMAEFDSSEYELSVQRFLTADFEEFMINHRMAVHDVYEIRNDGMQDIKLKGTYDQIACIRDTVPAVLSSEGSQMETSLSYVYEPQIQKYRSYEEYRAFFDSFEEYSKPALEKHSFTCRRITSKDPDQNLYFSIFPKESANRIYLYGLGRLEQHNERYLFEILKGSDVYYIISEQKGLSAFEILKKDGDEYLPTDNYSVQISEIGLDELTELMAHQFSDYDFETVKCVISYYMADLTETDSGLSIKDLSELFFPYLDHKVCIRHDFTLAIPAGKTVRMAADVYKIMNFDIRVEHQKTVKYDAEFENRDFKGYSGSGLKFDVRLSEACDDFNIQKSKIDKPLISIAFSVNWKALQ